MKRNTERFPDDFMFQLTRMELEYLIKEGMIRGEVLRSQTVISSKENRQYKRNLKSQTVISSWGGIRKLPFVFTEQGVAMLSSVLKSKKAIQMNITIMRTFVKIRQLVYSYKDLADKIIAMERKYDKKVIKIFEILDSLMKEKANNKKEIGFKA